MNTFDIAYGFSNADKLDTAVRQASVQVRERLSSFRIETCLILFNLPDDQIKDLPYAVKRVLNPGQIIGFSLPLLIVGARIFRRGLIIITFSGCRIVTGVSDKYGDVLSLSEKFSWKILKGSRRVRKSFFLSFSELNYSESFYLLRGTERGIGRNTFFTGIFSCKELGQGSLLYNENVLSDRSVGMFFLDNIESFAQVGSGFSPLGKGGRITAGNKNIIREIDHKPAIDFYRNYFGDRVIKDKEYYETVTMRYPLGFKLGHEPGYIITRPVECKKDGSLVIIKEILSEDIKLMIPTRQLLIESLKKACNNFVVSIKRPKICLVFDSFFRYKLLGTSYIQQLQSVSNILGKTPFVGGVSFYNMGSVSFPKLDLGHFIWENSFVVIGWGEK
jgi:hypothetical protein